MLLLETLLFVKSSRRELITYALYSPPLSPAPKTLALANWDGRLRQPHPIPKPEVMNCYQERFLCSVAFPHDKPFAENLAAQYAAVRNELYKSGKKIEILVNFTPKLHYVSEW